MTPKNQKVELPDLYFKMGEIDGKLDMIIAMMQKTIYALIALAGATVGLKLMGTPPLLIISSFINGFVFLFAGLLSVFSFKRRGIRGWQYILVFGLMGVMGNAHKVIAPGAVALRTCFFIVGNLALVVFLWQSDSWGHKKKIS